MAKLKLNDMEMRQVENGRIAFPIGAGTHADRHRRIELVGGAGDEPYLWIGDDVETFGATLSIGQMRLLRDSLTAALRRFDR